ncbi:hypothetical protein J4470_01060 [Candidatus Woesearchaeota archaeon]|nr:hypothetical protein [Candidatus Woesearchaeota archaeon]
MVFSKRFPKATGGSVYPKWVEISLTEEEEKEIERTAREGHAKLFDECIEDARKIVAERNLKTYQTDIISIASNLFDKRASHVVYSKERKCKEKFDASK